MPPNPAAHLQPLGRVSANLENQTVIIKMNLWTNPRGHHGGADFEVECIPGSGTLRLCYDDAKFPTDSHEAIAELARGLEYYAAQPDEERGVLPSAVFRVTKIHGDTTVANLSVYRTAGVFAASDFHKRVHARNQET